MSVKGETRLQRFASSEELWKWIDAHEMELGVGRPYLGRDPPHVAPIDGKEYAAKRGRPMVQKIVNKEGASGEIGNKEASAERLQGSRRIDAGQAGKIVQRQQP